MSEEGNSPRMKRFLGTRISGDSRSVRETNDEESRKRRKERISERFSMCAEREYRSEVR